MTQPVLTPTPPGPAPRTVPPESALDAIALDEDRLPRQPLQWFLLIAMAVVVGASVGVVGGLFRLGLEHLASLVEAVATWSHQHSAAGLGIFGPILLCGLCAALGCYLSQRWAPSAAGSGIPRVEAVLRNHVRPADAWILPVKFFGGILSIGAGLALGREGPTVQMGGTVGRLLGDGFKRLVPEPWTLIAAGAGAGLAVAFNAPLAATLFVVEELLHRFSARVFSATLASCISGTIVLRLLLGNRPELGGGQLALLPADVLPQYLLLGVLAGLLGVGFNVSLMRMLSHVDRLRALPRGSLGLIVGALVGVLIYTMPIATGGGERLAESALLGQLSLSLIVKLFVIRSLLMLTSYGTGAPGGLFAPLLALGALLGSGMSGVNMLLHHPAEGGTAPLAIVAMAALFTAVVRSPLTGVVLLLEMTGSWTLILPMMAASLTAYSVPELMGNPPIYDSLRERDIARERQASNERNAAGPTST